jgi:hypothetical protein
MTALRFMTAAACVAVAVALAVPGVLALRAARGLARWARRMDPHWLGEIVID